MSMTAPTQTDVDEPTAAAPPASDPALAPTVHIILLVDRSGSMSKIRADVLGGLNSFLAEQAAQPGACKLTMIQFDTQGFDYVYMAADLAHVRPMTETDFVPRGGTPLYDSIARAMGEADVRAATLKVPEVILFAIFTDGEDTSSSKSSKQDIFERIEEHQAKGWTVSLMMANADAYTEAGAMGIARGNTQAYLGDSGGAQAVYASFAANTTALRGAVQKGMPVNTSGFFNAAGKGAEDDLLARKPDDTTITGTTHNAETAVEGP